MTCDTFVDRLYDDDARMAGRGLREIPADIAGHMLACATCRTAYDAARADDRLLTRALVEVPAPAWRAQVLRQMARSPRASWTQRIATMNEMVICGILGIAATQILLGGGSTASVGAFSVGAVAALMRHALVKHWHVLLTAGNAARRSRSAIAHV